MNDLIGQFIEISACQTFGIIIDEDPSYIGTDKAVRVKVQLHPDDENGKWFNLEPGEYELIGE
jgi:hypothetical protein